MVEVPLAVVTWYEALPSTDTAPIRLAEVPYSVKGMEGPQTRFLTLPGKRFTEPVALLSTRPSDRPLPRRASRESFNLLALRARCGRHAMRTQAKRQGDRDAVRRNLR
jgi:hypothetical protein